VAATTGVEGSRAGGVTEPPVRCGREGKTSKDTGARGAAAKWVGWRAGRGGPEGGPSGEWAADCQEPVPLSTRDRKTGGGTSWGEKICEQMAIRQSPSPPDGHRRRTGDVGARGALRTANRGWSSGFPSRKGSKGGRNPSAPPDRVLYSSGVFQWGTVYLTTVACTAQEVGVLATLLGGTTVLPRKCAGTCWWHTVRCINGGEQRDCAELSSRSHGPWGQRYAPCSVTQELDEIAGDWAF